MISTFRSSLRRKIKVILDLQFFIFNVDILEQLFINASVIFSLNFCCLKLRVALFQIYFFKLLDLEKNSKRQS